MREDKNFIFSFRQRNHWFDFVEPKIKSNFNKAFTLAVLSRMACSLWYFMNIVNGNMSHIAIADTFRFIDRQYAGKENAWDARETVPGTRWNV